MAGMPSVVLGGKGILSNPKGAPIFPARDFSNVGFVVETLGIPKFIPKIKLIIFEGKEPRVWIRRCIKYLKFMGCLRSKW